MIINNFTLNHKKNLRITLLAQLVSNATSFLILVLGIFFLDPNKYLEIQITLSYLTFCGFTHLGIIDGIELRIAGSEINRNNYGLIALIIIILSSIPVLMYFILNLNELNSNVTTALLAFPLINLNTLFLIIFRSRGQSWIGAFGLFIEKTIVMLYLILTVKYFENFIIYFIFIPIFSLIYYIYNSKKEGIYFNIEYDLKQTKLDFKRGFSIMLSNTFYSAMSFGSLILASKLYNNPEVSKLAISITFINLFIGISTQISSVLFPLLANNQILSSQEEGLNKFKIIIEKYLSAFLLVATFLMFTVNHFFKFLFKNEDILSLVLAIIPIAFFEIKNQIINLILVKLRIKLRRYLITSIVSLFVGLFLFLLLHYFLNIQFIFFFLILIFSFIFRYFLLSFFCKTLTYFDLFFLILYISFLFYFL